MKVCSNCKTVNGDDSKFCVSCGAEIVGSSGMTNEFSNNQGFNNQNTMNQGQQYNVPNSGMHQGSNQTSNTNTNQMLYQWAPVIAAVLGVIISWFVDIELGALISLGALVMSIMMRQKASKPMISIVVSGIALVFCLTAYIILI